MRETANIIETFEDLRRSDPPLAVFVNDLESIHEVEIWLAGQSCLSILQFFLHAELLFQTAHQLFFFIKFEIGPTHFVHVLLFLGTVFRLVDLSDWGH